MRQFALTIIIAFLTTLLMGNLLIPWLRRLKFGQVVRDDGPKTHLSKTGTPTMGGILLFHIVQPSYQTKTAVLIAAVLSTAGFGLIGF